MIELLAAALTTVAALPAALYLLRFRSVIDVPNDRSLHASPVVRGGGLACMLGVACGLIVAQARGETVLWIAAAIVCAVGAVGFTDDIRSLPAIARLVAQAVAGAALGGLISHNVVAALAGALVLMVSVNVVNFMDGIDGISGLTAGLWGITALAFGTENHRSALAVIGAVTAGSALGFLPANLPVARLFLGDVGSYLLGGMIALGLLISAHGDSFPVVVGAPLSVYLADTMYTLLRRAVRRAPLLSAHREHVYQRLVSDVGLSHVQVAALAAICASAVTACWVPGFTGLGSAATVLILTGYLGSVPILRKFLPFNRASADGGQP